MKLHAVSLELGPDEKDLIADQELIHEERLEQAGGVVALKLWRRRNQLRIFPKHGRWLTSELR